MFKLIFSIIGAILKWVAFLIVVSTFWLVLTIINPDMRWVVIPFVIIFLIFNFPKPLLALIIAQSKPVKNFFRNITASDMGAEEDLEEIETDDTDEEEESSGLEEFIFKGCIVISLAFILLIGYNYFKNKSIEKEIALYKIQNLDIDTSMDPIQVNEKGEKFTITANGADYNVQPLAKYKIAGTVVVKNTFMVFDTAKDISPVDIGLVWGDLSKPENYKQMSFFSNFRLMTRTNPKDFPFSDDYIVRHTSHNHIIPANRDIEKQVINLDIDDRIVMEGSLVEVRSDKFGGPWTSSLRRDDHLFNSGKGCEIFYVEKVTFLNDFPDFKASNIQKGG